VHDFHVLLLDFRTFSRFRLADICMHKAIDRRGLLKGKPTTGVAGLAAAELIFLPLVSRLACWNYYRANRSYLSMVQNWNLDYFVGDFRPIKFFINRLLFFVASSAFKVLYETTFFLYDSTTIHDVRVALVQYRNLPAHLHPTFICGLYCLSSRVQARASQGKLVRWTRCCMICSACSHSIFLSAQLCKIWRGCCWGEMASFALKSSCSTVFC